MFQIDYYHLLNGAIRRAKLIHPSKNITLRNELLLHTFRVLCSISSKGIPCVILYFVQSSHFLC